MPGHKDPAFVSLTGRLPNSREGGWAFARQKAAQSGGVIGPVSAESSVKTLFEQDFSDFFLRNADDIVPQHPRIGADLLDHLVVHELHDLL